MAGLVLVLDRHTEDRLFADIVEHGHSVLAQVRTVTEFVLALPQLRPDVAVVGARRESLTGELIAACDARGIRVIALAASDRDRRYAATLGLLEVLDAAVGWPEIDALVHAGVVVPLRVGDRGRSVGAPRSGLVVAVWGPTGAPGRTTLAINIAAEIAAAGHTVVLADADTYSGSVAASLGMLDEAPGFAAACRLAGSDSLTQNEFERIAQRYNSPQGAFWVLTGIGRPSRWPELSSERVTRTIEALRHWADYVVIDTGFNLESDEELSSDMFAPRRNAATVTALRAADHVVACGLADPVGMARFLRAWSDLTDVISDTAVSVVMNRVRSSAVGLDPAGQVIGALRRFGAIEAPVLVPNDQPSLDVAVLTGRTLRDAAPKSLARASIRRFVLAKLVSAPATAAPRRTRRRRRALAPQ
ncbi:AAA family ATPase [Cryobacterium psychrophilum]|uniref:Regulator n=1 Tax=Cryobacterium psychrophilum TaxID=41988 RepID=A0A4Y8KKG0_9MICO|nr:regulator [Cryobacterium psychrophilum]TDW30751.1 MinD-like ATPase involved in chromosome partitioning or flagellar assembly [Cryobacterium psychrophilum]TFD75845.1 regulator [Cryobacterium psychrophilum]